ncbi:MAG: PAS domain S-box protein [Candidatus Jettenia sp. CY-1]|nr:MAG: PAS domain S-box protein [Candidatus Jettenia sp. CY-1]
MDRKPIKILLIEDNPGDVRLIQEMLKDIDFGQFELEHKDLLSSGLSCITRNNIDVILLDLGLPDSQGLPTLTKILSQAQKIPIVVLTGLDDEITGIRAIQAGAQDYLVKGQLESRLLVRSIRYAIERKWMEDDLRKLSNAVKQSPGIVVITDTHGNIEYVNPKFTQVTGYTSDEVIGKNPRILKSGKTSPEKYQQLWETITSGNEWRGEFVNRKKNGELYWDSTCVSPIKNSEGTITHFVAVMEDITEQKRMKEKLQALNESLEQRVAERTVALAKANKELKLEIAEHWQAREALRKSEAKYRILLENLPQKIFYKDKDLTYISCNESLAGDLHIRPDEILGKTDYDLYPKELAEKYRDEDMRVMKLGHTNEMEERYVKNGQELIIHIVRTPIKDEKGNSVGILGIFWDITEKVALEKEAILNRQLAALGEMAAGVAHEINNPITGIINCAQILFNKSNEGSREKDLANRIMKEGDRIGKIVHGLLSLARPNDKKEKKQHVHIHEILSDTLFLIEAQLRKDGIRVTLNIPQDLPEILAHPQQIQQVFLNLISNARYALNQKYPETHENKILEILGERTTIQHHPYIKITFYDHGIGMPAKIKDKAIKPFFTTKPHGKGTGLGLSISHKIIKNHGGKIVIDSIEGKFTKVALILPVGLKTM